MEHAETFDLAALALSTEVASDRLVARAHGKLTVTLSADEVRTIASRLNRLASVTRTLHAMGDGGLF